MAVPTTSGQQRSDHDWRGSPERRRRSVSQGIIAFLAVLSGGAGVVIWLAILDVVLGYNDQGVATGAEDVTGVAWAAGVVAALASLVLGLTWYARRGIARREYADRRDQEERERLRAVFQDASEEAETELTRLLGANRALLDEYQKPVRAQARTSYAYSQVALLVGLVVLVFGVVIIVFTDQAAARLAVGGLTGVGSLLSGYIARTYLRVYEKAQDQLNFYFREPLVTSYLLTAERLAAKLDVDRRQQAYAQMVGEIVRAVRADLDPGLPAPDASARQ
jgi:hypothetical protein